MVSVGNRKGVSTRAYIRIGFISDFVDFKKREKWMNLLKKTHFWAYKKPLSPQGPAARHPL
jgi:tRNA(His) 5'-end guanylyltransferase